MEILFENIMLVDDPTYKGGCSFDGETLADFIKEGYRDYAMVDTKHYEPDGYLYDAEGSQLMLYDSYKFYAPRVIIEKSLDIIYGKTDLDYIILNDD